jgi:hypothetical protein
MNTVNVAKEPYVYHANRVVQVSPGIMDQLELDQGQTIDDDTMAAVLHTLLTDHGTDINVIRRQCAERRVRKVTQIFRRPIDIPENFVWSLDYEEIYISTSLMNKLDLMPEQEVDEATAAKIRGLQLQQAA